MKKDLDIQVGKMKVACYCRFSAVRAWIYCRVDGADAVALEMQKQSLDRFAQEHGWKVAGVTSEISNGLRLQRPGLAELQNVIKAGSADVLLVSDLSRLCRSTDGAILCWKLLNQNSVNLWTLRDGKVDLSMETAIRNALLDAQRDANIPLNEILDIRNLFR